MSRARVSRKNAFNQILVNGVVVVAFALGCIGVNVLGFTRLDAASTDNARLQSAIVKAERANIRLQSQLDCLAHPDRLSKVAEGQGMMPIVPSALVSCSPPARMAKAVSPLSGSNVGD